MAASAAALAALVTLTLPEQIDAGHVAFARQLARLAARYTIEVERYARGLPALPARGADRITEIAAALAQRGLSSERPARPLMPG